MDGVNNASRAPLQPLKPGEESQQLRPGTKDPNSVSRVSAAEKEISDVQISSKKIEEKRHTYAREDILNQLLNLGKSPDPKNLRIAMAMLSYGIPFDKDHFEKVDQLMKGKSSGRELESIVISLSKNLGGNKKSLDVLNMFLTSQLNMNQALKQFKQQLHQFQAMMQKETFQLNPSIIQHLIGIAAAFDDNIKLQNDKKISLDNLKRYANLIKDSKLFLSILKGLDKKYISSMQDIKERNKLQHVFAKLEKSIFAVMDHLLAYEVLSKESDNMANTELFHFCQAPNNFDSGKKNINLLIKKRNIKNKSYIDEEKTKMLVQFETESLGEVTIIINVVDNSLSYVFNSETENTKQLINTQVPNLIEQMSALNYKVQKIENKNAKINLKRLICPVFDLDKLTHINTQA